MQAPADDSKERECDPTESTSYDGKAGTSGVGVATYVRCDTSIYSQRNPSWSLPDLRKSQIATVTTQRPIHQSVIGGGGLEKRIGEETNYCCVKVGKLHRTTWCKR